MAENYEDSLATAGEGTEAEGAVQDRPNVCQWMAVIEALLFISGDALSVADLKKLTGISEDEIAECMEQLLGQYRQRNGGIIIVELAGGYQMVSNPTCAQYIKHLKKSRPMGKLSLPTLETLAIVAYKQPITRAEVEDIRGVSADWILKSLLEKKLIKISGRKDAPGRPLLFATTREFLVSFGLKDLSELPTLREFTKQE
ncbi:MAG: SMC-Scp complex subunit ScpB [Candidatus Magnetobacterium sp. LHC-1]|uniref:SMC-Scp complex subunit ScpB n=1 Tax=Candidatus Magnetobacterium casense TaxID=1455061 RepID=A0ABS6RYT9_9BACT|nr:SMC-Scp complex subunit ScpB [Candidatus Magnetobacterium casensis]MBF0607620.1 SMC-Scp complex subunit ScpB [Nitrospirota bacterium]MBV6341809.1 SMC-Scp complex subunit ScpB [Candidatus Magnetobacterium casensis]